MPQTTGAEGVFLTDDMILKEALFQYKNNLVACKNVYRDMEKRMVSGIGDQISLKKPFRTKSTEGRTLGKSPLVDNDVTLTISRQRNTGLEFTMKDRTLSIVAFSERYIQPAIGEIATQVDKSIFDVASQFAYFHSGTVGTALSHTAVMFSKANMNNVSIPDMNRKLMVNEIDSANISSAVSALFNENIVKDSIQKGYVGPLSGFEVYSSQLVPTITVGDYGGTPLSNDATPQTGSSIVTDGWTASKTGLLKQGNIITFAGVFEINPVTYESTGRLQTFVVTADVNSDAGGNATIPISPSINDGTLTTTDAETGASVSLAAYQNVSAAIADGAAITVFGDANGVYRQNFLWHKNAIGLAMVDLYLPESAATAIRVFDKESGLSLSLTKDYDINGHQEVTRLDALWGVKVLNPELLFRMMTEKIA